MSSSAWDTQKQGSASGQDLPEQLIAPGDLERHAGPLRALIRGIAATFIRDIDDVVQEVFVKLVEDLRVGRRIPPEGPPAALHRYLYVMVKNKVIDQLRKRRRWQERQLPVVERGFSHERRVLSQLTAGMVVRDKAPVRVTRGPVTTEDLEEGIKTLPIRLSEVLNLALKGYNDEEIAAALHKRPNTIRKYRSEAEDAIFAWWFQRKRPRDGGGV